MKKRIKEGPKHQLWQHFNAVLSRSRKPTRSGYIKLSIIMWNETAVLYQHSVGQKHHLLLCHDDVLYVSKEIYLDFLRWVDKGFPGIVLAWFIHDSREIPFLLIGNSRTKDGQWLCCVVWVNDWMWNHTDSFPAELLIKVIWLYLHTLLSQCFLVLKHQSLKL